MRAKEGMKIEVIDVKDYPEEFGVKLGMIGVIESIFKYDGHAVAYVRFPPRKSLAFNEDKDTYPLSLTRLKRK